MDVSGYGLTCLSPSIFTKVCRLFFITLIGICSPMENKFPFIASIIGSVIVWLATFLFFQEYLALTSFIIFVSIILLRFNAWALIGGFLTGLAFELFNKERQEEFYIVVGLLILGVVLQTLLQIVGSQQRSWKSTAPQFLQTMAFATTGLVIYYLLLFWRCPPTTDTIGISNLVSLFSGTLECSQNSMSAYFNKFSDVNGLQKLNILVKIFFLWLISIPGIWASFFAVAYQKRFSIFNEQFLIKAVKVSIKTIFFSNLILLITSLSVMLLGILYLATRDLNSMQQATVDRLANYELILLTLFQFVVISSIAARNARK